METTPAKLLSTLLPAFGAFPNYTHHPLFFYVPLFPLPFLYSPSNHSLHLLSPALSTLAVMNDNDCECQIRWNDVYRTLRRQAGVRANSRHSSLSRLLGRQKHVSTLPCKDYQTVIQPRAAEQPMLFFFITPRDQSEHALWLCCHGRCDKDVEKCQTSWCHGNKITHLLRSKEQNVCPQLLILCWLLILYLKTRSWRGASWNAFKIQFLNGFRRFIF